MKSLEQISSDPPPYDVGTSLEIKNKSFKLSHKLTVISNKILVKIIPIKGVLFGMNKTPLIGIILIIISKGYILSKIQGVEWTEFT